MAEHIPVLKKEILQYLNPGQDKNFIDATVGEGGHALEIMEKTGPNGRLLGIDLDPHQAESANWLSAKFGSRATIINGSYTDIKEIAEKNSFQPINGILLDLGMSSKHIDALEKGFSFKTNQGLDMRYNELSNNQTAEKIVNEWPEKKLEEIFTDYGEERYAKKIAQEIVEQRKKERIKTTFDLVNAIKNAVPKSYLGQKIHFATRTFQALRIAVNDELENLKRVLPQALEILAPQGRLAVISFHSLEDRIAKNFFKESEKNKKAKILTKKPVEAGLEEIKNNPRSRSAKLRVLEKI